MKRYNIRVICASILGDADLIIQEDRNGEWVKYEDVKGMISESSLKGEIRKLRHEVKSLQQVIRIASTIESLEITGESVECNCVEMSKGIAAIKSINPYDNIWICPAHGYKRL